MFGWLSRLFSSDSKRDLSQRWDAAETDRLNEKQWSRATNQPINADLSLKLETLRTRAAFEASNNSFVEGVISTHAVDVVGEDGPNLQVMSGDKSFDEALEEVFGEWWQAPDVTGELSGPDLLQQWIRLMYPVGEFFVQIVTNDKISDDKSISVRLNSIDPRRLMTPPNEAGNPGVVLGIERDKLGKPLRYWIEEGRADTTYQTSFNVGPFVPLEAREVVHCFKRLEPGQARGVPWLAPVLQMLADVRDYDKAVLDAAQTAADFGVILHTKHPEARYYNPAANETLELQRRMITTAPPGWEPFEIKPEQPGTLYKDYRAERLRELGRVVNMPLMMVMLDSSNHNYSSARFDGQIYNRGNRVVQGWLERCALNKFVDIVAREAHLLGMIKEKPKGTRYDWTWPSPPHVDPQKEARADDILLANFSLAMEDALANRGTTLEAHLEKLTREREAFKAAGIPWPREAVVEEESDNATPSTPKNGTTKQSAFDAQDIIDRLDDVESNQRG